MGTTNMQQWNPTAVNQETDAEYAADSQRTGGATNPSIFEAELANKAYYQWSTFLTALFQAFAAKGFTTSDSNLSTLTATCANFLTTADIKPPQVIVPYSPTPTFDCSLASSFRINLTGDVTSSSLINVPQAGVIVNFFIVSSNPGVWSFAWPPNVVGAPSVQTQSPGNLLSVAFISDGGSLYLLDNFLDFLSGQITDFIAAQTAENTTLAGLANAAQTSANTALTEIAALQVTYTKYDVSTARFLNTTYTNPYGHPMTVTGSATTNGGGNVGSVQCFVNGIEDFGNTVGATVNNGVCGFSFEVPVGATYEIVANSLTNGQGTAVSSIRKWIETVVTI